MESKIRLKNDFSTFDIERGLGIPRGRLREWLLAGYVAPTVPASGQGTRASFRLNDVYAIALFRELVEAGLARDEAGKWVRGFTERDQSDQQYRADYLIFRTSIKGGQRLVSVTPVRWNVKLSTDHTWRLLHIVNVAALCDEVDQEMARL